MSSHALILLGPSPKLKVLQTFASAGGMIQPA